MVDWMQRAIALDDENRRLLDALSVLLPSAAEIGEDRAVAWCELSHAVAAKMRLARDLYGERIPAMPPDAVVDEVLAEVADICGWSVLLWHRIQKLKQLSAHRERTPASPEHAAECEGGAGDLSGEQP